MTLGLGYVDGPKLGGSLVIFFGIMMCVAVIVGDNGTPSETFITPCRRGGGGHLRRGLFPRALK